MESRTPVPLANVLDLLLDAICVVDVEGRFLSVSAAFERIFGYAPVEVLGTPMINLVHPDDRERTLRAAAEIMAGAPREHFENRYIRKDGRVVDIMWSARWSEPDQARIAVARDVTEPRRAERLRAALYAISEAANAAEDLLALFRRIHDILAALLPARNCYIALHDEKSGLLQYPYFVDERGPPPAPSPLDAGTPCGEVVRSGQALMLPPTAAAPDAGLPARRAWLGVPLGSAKGVIGALVVQDDTHDARYTVQDLALLQFVSTQIGAAIVRKQSEEWLHYVARHDPLTDLPNRELLQDRLETALARARREGSRLGLLYLDLDHFKQVNDTRGHAGGDVLLQEVARRITASVRDADTVSRIGGDEFVVLLPDLAQRGDAARIAAKIRQALASPCVLSGEAVQIAASIGVATCPEHGSEHKLLMRLADEAMYAAKAAGGDCVRESPASAATDDDGPPAAPARARLRR